MLRYALFVIRHRLYSLISSTTSAAARRSQQQATASTSASVQEQRSICSFGGCDYLPGTKMIKPIVLSGPSGGGKSTILAKAMKEYPDVFAFSVSHTTRKPRNGELDGEHYHFVERTAMERMIAEGEFFEHAQFGDNLYGTSKKAVAEICGTGRICVLDVELQGVHNFKSAQFDAKYILIRPPSLEVLENRLRQRGTETEESIAKRLKHAKEDLQAVEKEPTLFDVVVINEQLDKAYADFLDAIRPELDAIQQKKEKKSSEESGGGGGLSLVDAGNDGIVAN